MSNDKEIFSKFPLETEFEYLGRVLVETRPVSYSGLNMYDTCPRSFKYKYIDKEPVKNPPTRETAPKMFRGSDIHKSIEDFLKGQTNKVHAEILQHNSFITELRTKGATAEDEFAFDKTWSRVAFDDPIAIIRGKFDAMICKENSLVIYEWKTGKVYPEHKIQRNLYGLAGLLLYPEYKKVIVQTYYLDLDLKRKANTSSKSEYGRNQLLSYQWLWERKINKVQPPQPYPMRPGWKCGYCDYSKNRGGKCPN